MKEIMHFYKSSYMKRQNVQNMHEVEEMAELRNCRKLFTEWVTRSHPLSKRHYAKCAVWTQNSPISCFVVLSYLHLCNKCRIWIYAYKV